jgi:hypothetical protein
MAQALIATAEPVAVAGRRAPVIDDKLARRRREYQDFIGSKNAEISEMKESRRYYHAAQWTANEIKTLNERGQPVITYNRIGRKIDGVVGLIERLRQDPKAFPRTPKHEEGAELATAVLNYVLDTNDWRAISPDVAHKGAVDGIGGVELSLVESENGDPDVEMALVDPEDFFYDPRSFKPDFSDARYLGVAKWLDLEAAVDLFPDAEADLRDHVGGDGGSGEMSPWDDRELLWTNVRARRVRVVEHWYKARGEWHFCFYTGTLLLQEGVSPFVDEKGKTFCRFLMYSNGIDHDGDRYGFCRNLKGPQDEVNQRRSKALHLFNSRRIIAEDGAVDDVERARKEAARADGFLIVNKDYRFEFDDAAKNAEAAGNLNMLNEAKAELENFGPNPALIGQGTGVAGSSGRAIALLQQAGIAELGPFILRYRGWKLRVYRAIWNTVQRYWTSERWIRVTDSEDLAQFIQVNGLEMGPLGPQMVNALGQLDVDIILDEGPDQVNSMADAYDTLMAMSDRGNPVPPEIIMELSSLPSSVKKRILEKLQQAQQPNPMAQQGAMLELEDKAANIEATRARAAKDMAAVPATQAKTRKDMAEAADTTIEAALKASPFTGLEPLGPVEQAFTRGPAQ